MADIRVKCKDGYEYRDQNASECWGSDARQFTLEDGSSVWLYQPRETTKKQPYETEIEFLEDILDSLKAEYRELSETWRHIEGKAQGTVTILGIFLAGVFAFIRLLPEDATSIEKWFLVAALALLAFSIVRAVLALKIRVVTAAPMGEALDEKIEDLLTVQGWRSSERMEGFLSELNADWRTVNREVHTVNSTKARHVFHAQVSLFLAIGIVGISAVLSIFDAEVLINGFLEYFSEGESGS